jgi:hypothetical protein
MISRPGLRWTGRVQPKLMSFHCLAGPPSPVFSSKERAGMVLEKDFLRPDGSFVVLKQGSVLTDTWIERLENFAGVRGANGLIDVLIPKTRASGAPANKV